MNEKSSDAIAILLIEDDDVDALLFRRMLAKCHTEHQLHVCSTLEAAISRLESHHCDIVFLDHSLPDSFGPNGVQVIHQAHQDVPVVMLTGLECEEAASEAVASGARDYLFKGDLDEKNLTRVLAL